MENEERKAAPGPTEVELAYMPTSADMTEALSARTSPTARGRLPLIAGLISAAVLVVLLMLAAPGAVLAAVAATGLCTVLGSLVGGWANQRHRARQLTTYARSQGGYTMRADDDGIHATTAVAETTIPWASFRHCIETANLFVLVIDDTVGGMAVLPKRGLRDGADADGLRAVVARHVTPVSPAGQRAGQRSRTM
ncbi:YcxB family protein [Streptomyces sp. WAC 00631]|uniref:YcxB family protein n=1 Tax=Streptomyces sp. WAC 00631 TaxID=2203201 RepID=UPI00163C652C|nr:YcxB family protein [Streptomyces sp. WAC 00631]MCC5033468.1 YcxB family protein [Streptomyces sp. WAC 00631]